MTAPATAGPMLASSPQRPAIDLLAPSRIETATFALGWFWGPDSRFGSLDAVVRTRVGYAGGTQPRPTYHDLGDHAEAVQFDFDPERVTYGELLDLFFADQRPTSPPWSRQYMSAIFVADEAQKRLAVERRRQVAERLGTEIFVEILSADSFYRAEDYHQKYYLQRYGELVTELRAAYPDFRDFVDSTAAARLNGFIGGSRTHDLRREDLNQLGLSETGQRILLKAARGR